MTEAQENMRFKHLFWFAVGLVAVATGFSAFVVYKYPNHIDIIITFWLTSAAMTAINFALGNSSSKSATPKTLPEGGDIGGKTLSLNLEATTTPPPDTSTPTDTGV